MNKRKHPSCISKDFENDKVRRTKRPSRCRKVKFHRSTCAVAPDSLPAAVCCVGGNTCAASRPKIRVTVCLAESLWNCLPQTATGQARYGLRPQRRPLVGSADTRQSKSNVCEPFSRQTTIIHPTPGWVGRLLATSRRGRAERLLFF